MLSFVALGREDGEADARGTNGAAEEGEAGCGAVGDASVVVPVGGGDGDADAVAGAEEPGGGEEGERDLRGLAGRERFGVLLAEAVIGADDLVVRGWLRRRAVEGAEDALRDVATGSIVINVLEVDEEGGVGVGGGKVEGDDGWLQYHRLPLVPLGPTGKG